MLRKIQKYIITFFLVSCLFITACSTEDVNNIQSPSSQEGQNSSQVSKDLEYLCSDECGGRYQGTPGNIKAGEYIAGRFEEIGLKPLSNNYAIPYKKPVDTIKEINLELLDADKFVYTFNYGRDYVEAILDNTVLELPLFNEPSNVDCAVLTDSQEKVSQYMKNGNIKLILRKEQEKYTRGRPFYNKDYTPQIEVSKEAFEILEKNIGKTLKFNTKIDTQEMELQNIAGIIEGENHDSALIVSAHFDHIGSAGEPGSPDYVVWRGALDNASGVSAMLETARCLRNIYKDKKPPFDIIFCAFNGEEELITKGGSSYFLEYMKGKYSSVFDVNLDCLGNTDSSTLFIANNENAESKEAARSMLENLKTQNINAQFYKENFTSDHTTFSDAICLTTVPDFSKSNIHSLSDTPDRINTNFLAEIAEKLAVCIRDTISTINIGSMKLSGSSNDTEPVLKDNTLTLTPSEFENRFSCKLDLLNPQNVSIFLQSRIGFDPPGTQSDVEDKTPKSISDIRHFNFVLDSCVITFSTYKTQNKYEMEVYKEEMSINERDDKSKAQQVSIGENTYYIFTHEGGNYKSMNTEFEGKDILIHIYINTSEFNDFTSPKEYEDFFKEHVTEKFVDGMVKLLQERG